MDVIIFPSTSAGQEIEPLRSNSYHTLRRSWRNFRIWIKAQLQRQRLLLVLNPHPWAGNTYTAEIFDRVIAKVLCDFTADSSIDEKQIWDLQFDKIGRQILDKSRLMPHLAPADVAVTIREFEEGLKPHVQYAMTNELLSQPSVEIILRSYGAVIIQLLQLARQNQRFVTEVWIRLLENRPPKDAFALEVATALYAMIEDDDALLHIWIDILDTLIGLPVAARYGEAVRDVRSRHV